MTTPDSAPTTTLVRRTFLVQRDECWRVDTADAADLQARLDTNFGETDEWICSNGTLVSDEVALLDDDNLTVHIVRPED